MGIMKRLSEQLLSSRRKPKANLHHLPFEISLESMSEADKFARRQDKDSVEQFNKDVSGWSINTTRRLKANVRMMVREDRKLSDSINPNVYYDNKYGVKEANRIGFSFVREGIHIHKGAGRGQGGYKGSKWYNQYGEQKTTQLSSLAKMGTGNRKPIEWFDPVIDQELPQLADLVAGYSVTLFMDASRIYIDK
ncbi:hypothetical protein JGH11_04590 [Dysgonomonas sp. Marseille-P4677]|uniref:hypothetical protein n=1 Tax=Dysgonomonas sp. Marseille-P4677 TaxID=2364790 RepID=UPI00191461EA|nr:hypothetical protein [Dysgonomonas sp. Marseille-P4677]MBK5720145.1 hypothetical protein [Dysgonomonas sp. Marseille-P4677]